MSIAIVPPPATAVTSGSAVSEVESGLISAGARKERVPTGALVSPIAASFGGSFHQAM